MRKFVYQVTLIRVDSEMVLVVSAVNHCAAIEICEADALAITGKYHAPVAVRVIDNIH